MGDRVQEQENIYSFMKLLFLIASGALLTMTIWMNVTNYTALISAPIMFTCSVGLTFYGKFPKTETSKKRRVTAVKYSLSVLVILILLLVIVGKIPVATLLIGKIIFTLIPVWPTIIALLDYSEENEETKAVGNGVRRDLIADKVAKEEAKKAKPQQDKGEQRGHMRKKAINEDLSKGRG